MPNTNKMRLLVTGGAGFIGSHIVDLLLAEGHEIVVVDNLSTGRRENLSAKVPLEVLDIREPAVITLIKQGRFDALIHQAAQVSVVRSVQNPILDASINVLGTINLLQAAVEAGIKRFVFASTGGAIYGDQTQIPTTEDQYCKPDSPYGIAKLCVERYLTLFERLYGLSWVALRYSNVFGPRQNPHSEAGVIATFCQQLISGKKATIFGSGEQTRDFIFVKDVAWANLLALHSDYIGILNIGTGVETTINQIYRELSAVAASHQPPIYVPARKGEMFRSCIDSQKAASILKWKPQISLHQGLNYTFHSFKNLI